MPTKKLIEPSMILISANWGPTESFKMIPASKECPYVECIYNPTGKVLAVIGTISKEAFHTVPRLNEDGDPQKRKFPTEQQPHKTQRVTQETFSEYYIFGKDEVEAFIKMFAVNAEDFDYSKYTDMKTMDSPNASGIETPPLIIEP